MGVFLLLLEFYRGGVKKKKKKHGIDCRREREKWQAKMGIVEEQTWMGVSLSEKVTGEKRADEILDVVDIPFLCSSPI